LAMSFARFTSRAFIDSFAIVLFLFEWKTKILQ